MSFGDLIHEYSIYTIHTLLSPSSNSPFVPCSLSDRWLFSLDFIVTEPCLSNSWNEFNIRPFQTLGVYPRTLNSTWDRFCTSASNPKTAMRIPERKTNKQATATTTTKKLQQLSSENHGLVRTSVLWKKWNVTGSASNYLILD